MKKIRKEQSKAKQFVMKPQFRSQTQKSLKGKGSYNRKASHKYYDEATAA